MTRNLKNMILEKVQILQNVLSNSEGETVVIDGVQLSTERVQYMISEANKIASDEKGEKHNLYFIPLSLLMKEESWKVLQNEILKELEPESNLDFER